MDESGDASLLFIKHRQCRAHVMRDMKPLIGQWVSFEWELFLQAKKACRNFSDDPPNPS